MRLHFTSREIGLQQMAIENIDPPGGIGRGVVARTFAEMAMAVVQDRGRDLLDAIFHGSPSQPAENR